MAKKKKMSAGKKVAIGAGAAAAAAGAYYFFGPKGKEHRMEAGAWATKAEQKFLSIARELEMQAAGKANKVIKKAASKVAKKAAKIAKKK